MGRRDKDPEDLRREVNARLAALEDAVSVQTSRAFPLDVDMTKALVEARLRILTHKLQLHSHEDGGDHVG